MRDPIRDLRPLDVAPVAYVPPFDVRRPPIYGGGDEARRAREAALLGALSGVELGAYDRQIIGWLAGWDTPTVGTLVSLLDRVRAAGSAR